MPHTYKEKEAQTRRTIVGEHILKLPCNVYMLFWHSAATLDVHGIRIKLYAMFHWKQTNLILERLWYFSCEFFSKQRDSRFTLLVFQPLSRIFYILPHLQVFRNEHPSEYLKTIVVGSIAQEHFVWTTPCSKHDLLPRFQWERASKGSSKGTKIWKAP